MKLPSSVLYLLIYLIIFLIIYFFLIVLYKYQVLNAAELKTKEVIASFSQDHSNPLSCPITMPVRGRCTPHAQLTDIFQPLENR